MIQPKHHVKWREFILAKKQYSFTFLATKMLAQRIELALKKDNSEATVQRCLEEAHTFFTK